MSRSPRMRRRGLTIPEILVAAFLLALLLGIVARFFQIGGRITTEELGRNKAEAVLLTLLTKFRRDMSTAAAPGLSLSEGGEVLLIHPVTLSDVGSVVYQSRLLLWVFRPDTKQVARKEALTYSGFVFDGTPFRAAEGTLLGLDTIVDFNRTANLFSGITKFKIETNPGVDPPFLGSPLVLEVDVEVPASTTRTSISLREVFHLRNSGS